jgi:isoleucyl-tRNA synthetase
MSDYKSSLNLPSTNFSMKANLANRESIFLKKWQDGDVYNEIRKSKKNKPKFILHDGPPYANGDIHIGHAVNKVLKDIIVKSKSLSGFDAPYVPGWDCHGLPVELNIEKKKGKVGHKINASDFRNHCRKYTDTQIEKQKQDFMRLGILGDWNNPYLTKNFKFEADIIRALAKIVENGHLTKGYKPVHWCTECRSALAEAEVEYKNKQSDSIDVKFKFVDNSIFNTNKPVSVIAWTTTPWTLVSNEAIALNKDLEYVLIDVGDEYYLLAQELAEKALSRYKINNAKINSKTFLGSELELLKVQHPFYDKQVPIILAEHVTTESGTGVVHTAPSHGQEDFVVGLNYNLPIECKVDNKGVFFETVDLLAGQFIFKANLNIIEILKNNNNLVNNETFTHSYPHCWRHKSPVIFRATPQWFVAMDKNKLRDKAKDEINNVKWIPSWGKNRIELMVANRPDWCISRQRFWGVPITIFVNKKTGKLHPNTKQLFSLIAENVEKHSIDYWFDTKAEDLLDDADDFEKVTDTLDVWFDSGVSHYAVLRTRKDLSVDVADLYLEGSDQHRGWFQSSLITSCAINGKAPYKQVLTHGFTVDENGHKMSKSLGNVIVPQKIANSLGADILRLWIASSDYTAEMRISDEILKSSADSYRRIRNTMRFMLANMHGFDFNEHSLGINEMVSLDVWILLLAEQKQKQIQAQYEKYNFHQVVHTILDFCTNYLSGFYLDIIKDRQYTTQKNSIARRSAQTALYHLSHTIINWLSPILSFTAEEIWQELMASDKPSVFLNEWYCLPLQELNDEKINQTKIFDEILSIKPYVQQQMELMRADKIIGSSLDVNLDIYCKGDIYNKILKLKQELRFVFITSDAKVYPLEDKTNDSIMINKDIWIKVTKSEHKKCERCWHHRLDVGSNKKHIDICARCIENVFGAGENRSFA